MGVSTKWAVDFFGHPIYLGVYSHGLDRKQNNIKIRLEQKGQIKKTAPKNHGDYRRIINKKRESNFQNFRFLIRARNLKIGFLSYLFEIESPLLPKITKIFRRYFSYLLVASLSKTYI